MKSINYYYGAILLVLVHQSTVTQGQPTTINKGAEIPDDYADALRNLEKEIGSGSATAAAARDASKKLHKRANDDNLDELHMFKSQIDERRRKKKKKKKKKNGSKAMLKGELRLSPEEIASKTDEELLEIYYSMQLEKKAQVDELHQRVTETLKGGDLTPDEKQQQLKKKKFIEKRKQSLSAHDELGAKMWIESQRRRAAAHVGDEL
eukprot:scaffold48767_cov67-Cyclotella_meneghiniana.AAC.9